MMIAALIAKLKTLPPNVPVLIEDQVDFFPVAVEVIGKAKRAQFVLLRANTGRHRSALMREIDPHARTGASHGEGQQ